MKEKLSAYQQDLKEKKSKIVPKAESFTTAIQAHSILKLENGVLMETIDQVVVEEPLEIQIRYFQQQKWQKKSLAITMRTPGKDIHLAIGFLFSEGIIGGKGQIDTAELISENVVQIQLAKSIKVDLSTVERNFYATSSCGVCGKASIDKLERTSCYFPQKNLPIVSSSMILNLPNALRNIQPVFDQTGGIHAAGLFLPDGKLLMLAEDVGRHNAVDKLIGQCVENQLLPLRQHILLLSGRISFELVQKAMMAGIPIIAAVGAPSSLAIELAVETGITLIGFLRDGRFNVYSGVKRVS